MRDDNNRRGFKIPTSVKDFDKLTLKKFKKDNRGFFESKKEIKRAYFVELIEFMPDVINLLVRFGHIDEVREIKNSIYNKLTDADFVGFLIEGIKDDDVEFDNMELLPKVIRDITLTSAKIIKEAEEKNEEVPEFDLSDLIELSKLILRKKIKKMKKAGIDEDIAFDILSIIPTEKVLAKSQAHHLREMFMCLYEHGKTKEVKFDKIVEILFKDEEQYIYSCITFALLERKEKIGNFNTQQQKLFTDITEFCCKTLEASKKADIQATLKAYIANRERDEKQNKDSNRRIYISALPEDTYPKIIRVVKEFVKSNEKNSNYF